MTEGQIIMLASLLFAAAIYRFLRAWPPGGFGK